MVLDVSQENLDQPLEEMLSGKRALDQSEGITIVEQQEKRVIRLEPTTFSLGSCESLLVRQGFQGYEFSVTPNLPPDLDMVKNSYDRISGVLTITYQIGACPTAFKLRHTCPLLQLTQACLKSFVMSFVDIRQRTISIIEHPPQNKLEAVIQLLEVLAEPVHQASMPPEYDRVPQQLRREVAQRAQHLVR